jgi:PAS domain-containing protein
MADNHNEPSSRSRELLETEIGVLRQRLEEAETTLDAITRGRGDARVISHTLGERRPPSLQGAPSGDRLPIDRLRQGAITVSAAGIVLYANGAFGDLLDVDEDGLVGRDIRGLVSERDHETLTSILSDRSTAPLTTLGFERSSGDALRLHVACIPLVNVSGICLIVTGLHDDAEDDATDSVRARHHDEVDALVVAQGEDDPKVLLLGAAGRRYRLLVEHMRDGAVTLSADGDVVYANPAFATMIGASPGISLIL